MRDICLIIGLICYCVAAGYMIIDIIKIATGDDERGKQ